MKKKFFSDTATLIKNYIFFPAVLLLMIILSNKLHKTPDLQASSEKLMEMRKDTLEMLLNIKEYELKLEDLFDELNKKAHDSKFIDSLTNKKLIGVTLTNLMKADNTQAKKKFEDLQKDILHLKITSIINQSPDIEILVLIMLICGLLGGYAGSKYDLLKKHLPAIAAALGKIDKSIAEGGQTEGDNTFEIRDPQNNLRRLDSAVKETTSEIDWVYILFGVIASATTFLILSITKSSILYFNTKIDYLAFAGCCLLAAVLAKNWLEAIFNRIFINSGSSAKRTKIPSEQKDQP